MKEVCRIREKSCDISWGSRYSYDCNTDRRCCKTILSISIETRISLSFPSWSRILIEDVQIEYFFEVSRKQTLRPKKLNHFADKSKVVLSFRCHEQSVLQVSLCAIFFEDLGFSSIKEEKVKWERRTRKSLNDRILHESHVISIRVESRVLLTNFFPSRISFSRHPSCPWITRWNVSRKVGKETWMTR
jgi:hypothetical protein